MNKSPKITAAIVLYKESEKEVIKAINSCLSSKLVYKLFLIDNSPTDKLRHLGNNNSKIEYRFTGKNIGFGKGHNLILESLKNDSDFHLILNPDVWFNPKILEQLIIPFSHKSELSLIAPQLLYPNNKIQLSSRKQPTFIGLLKRFLGFGNGLNYKGKKVNDYSNCFSAEFLHGAFLLFKTESLLEVNGFDRRYFLYMEDADICRELTKRNKQMFYYSGLQAYHVLKRASRKNLFLTFCHISSAIKYFIKWHFLSKKKN